VTAAPEQAVRRRALVLLALLTLVWGTNWPLFPMVMREISVWTFRSVSMTGAGLLLLCVARLRGQPLAVPRQHWAAVAGGALVYLALWNVGSALAAVLIPSGQAAVLGFTMPVWAALIGWLVFGQRLSARQWGAVALAAAGVLLLAWRNLQAYAQAPLGMALALLSAVGWAVGTLIIKRSGVAVPATVLTGWQLLVASLPVTAGAVAFGQGPWFLPSPLTLLLLAYISGDRAGGCCAARWPAGSPSGRPGCGGRAGSCPRAGWARRAGTAGSCSPLRAGGCPCGRCRRGRR
jgi:drug/metabolite transporter (DMT)-like permease